MEQLEFVRGDTMRFTATCLRPDINGTVIIDNVRYSTIDLTGAHLWCTVKAWHPDAETDDDALVQVESPLVGNSGINILNQVTNKGQAQVIIPAGVTSDVGENAVYRFDVQVLESDDTLSTPVVGTVKFVPDVTFAIAP